MVEGYLAIAPYRCIGCLAHMPADHFAELSWLMDLVVDFYAQAYGTSQITFYEQGRSRGGATTDEKAGFPLHAHLCSLPLALDLRSVLHRSYHSWPLSSLSEIADITSGQPYLYVATGRQQSVYVALSPEGASQLATMRLKPILAALIGMPERGHWRDYPGDRELARVIDQWSRLQPTLTGSFAARRGDYS